MSNIFGIYGKKIFSIEEAESLLPLLYRLTDESSRSVKSLMKHIEALPDKKSLRASDIEKNINEIIEKWQNKLEKLGVVPKGLWLADFDNGKGYFCWKFPETKIAFWHGYQDGFSGRQPLELQEVVDVGLEL